MVNPALRSELGLESSEWDTAGRFAIALRQIDVLAESEQDVVNRDKELKWIAKQLYNILFRSLSRSLLDNERKCMWYFGRDVRLFLVSYSNLMAITHITAAPDSRPQDPTKLRHDSHNTIKPLHILLRYQFNV